MDCKEVREKMDGLLDSDQDGAGRLSMEQHFAGCETCARLYEDLRAVERWARGLKPVSPRDGFAERVMARVAVEEPANAVSPSVLGVIVAAVVLMAVALAFLAGSGTVSEGVAAAAASAASLAESFATDLIEAGGEAVGALTALWSSLEQVQGLLSPVWIALSALVAFLFMVIFNLVQARTLAYRTSRFAELMVREGVKLR